MRKFLLEDYDWREKMQVNGIRKVKEGHFIDTWPSSAHMGASASHGNYHITVAFYYGIISKGKNDSFTTQA